MKPFCKIFIVIPAFIVLQSCTPDPEQKINLAKADSLYVRVRCIETVSALIEKTLLMPAQKSLVNKIDYINETYPDTISKTQAEKLMQIKNMYSNYNLLAETTRDLQKRSALQLLQVSKLNTEIANGKEENSMQYLTFESKCSDTLNAVLDTVIKKAIELGCKSKSL